MRSAAIALLSIMLLVSCTLEFSPNGKLDGFWHLTSVDTLSTNGRADLSQMHRFWGFNFNLLNLQNYGDSETSRFFLRFDYSDNTLRIYEPRNGASGASAGETIDTLINNPQQLSPYGINSLDETFTIERLNSNSMTLSTDSLRLNFKKM